MERPINRDAEFVGMVIRHHREALGLTQSALAEEMRGRSDRPIRVHQSSISNWEKGRSVISLRYRRLLAAALEVPMEVLFRRPPEGWRAPSERVAA